LNLLEGVAEGLKFLELPLSKQFLDDFRQEVDILIRVLELWLLAGESV
jgi:hypothetical protein